MIESVPGSFQLHVVQHGTHPVELPRKVAQEIAIGKATAHGRRSQVGGVG
jgi:hypothetical protein